MDPAKRAEMRRLVEALGIWSKPPGEGEGPSYEEEELKELSEDLDLLHEILDKVEKLHAGTPKQKLLKSVKDYISMWEREAVALDRKLRAR